MTDQAESIYVIIQYVLYLFCAIFACISNGMFLIFFLSPAFHRRYIMLAAFSFGYLIDGTAYLLAGTLRLKYLYENTFYTTTTARQCLTKNLYPILMILGGQFPVLINACITLEKIIALQFAVWYRNKWGSRHKFCLVIFSAFLCMVSLAVAIIIVWSENATLTTRKCSVFDTSGSFYGTFHYVGISMIYLICFLLLLAVFSKMNSIKIPTKEAIRRQRLLLTITGISVLFISLPATLLTLKQWNIPNYHPAVTSLFNCLLSLHSGIPVISYCIYIPEIRKKLLAAFHLGHPR